MAAHQLFLFQLRRWQRKPQAIEPDNPRGVFFEEALEAIRLLAVTEQLAARPAGRKKKKEKKWVWVLPGALMRTAQKQSPVLSLCRIFESAAEVGGEAMEAY